MNIWLVVFWICITGLFSAGLGYYAGIRDEQKHQDRIRQAVDEQTATQFPWRLNREQQ